MYRESFYIAFLTIALCLPRSVASSVYTNGINESSWRTDLSVFECRMEHAIPHFGEAVFRTRAGEDVSFLLEGFVTNFKAGKAALEAKAPAWKSRHTVEKLGYVPVEQSSVPVVLGVGKTEQLLDRLRLGMELEVRRKAWFNPPQRESTKVIVSTIGFQEAYERYLGCLASLLPANFDQLKRTSLHYSQPRVVDLDQEAYVKLDHIVTLVQHDKSIKKFYIDGHASAPGTRMENLELSKTRAELVAEYLKNKGIPQDQMVVRWHGERYPIASNVTPNGRKQNRRVTVRLERVEDGTLASAPGGQGDLEK